MSSGLLAPIDGFQVTVVNGSMAPRIAMAQFTLPEAYLRDSLGSSWDPSGITTERSAVIACLSHPGIQVFEYPAPYPSVRMYGFEIALSSTEEIVLDMQPKLGEAQPAPMLPPIYRVGSDGEVYHGLFVTKEDGDAERTTARLQLEIETDRVSLRSNPFHVKNIESAPACDVVQLQASFPESQFVADLWLRVKSGSPIAAWELMLTCSNPDVPHLTETIKHLRLRWVARPGELWDVFDVPHILLRLPSFARGWRPDADTHILDLMPASGENLTFGDTQAIEWRGSFVKFSASDTPQDYANAHAEVLGPVYALADVWDSYLPPWGTIADRGVSQKIHVLERLASRFHPVLQSRHAPWMAPALGLSYDSGRTGDQEDFGSIRGEELFPGTTPILLWELEWAAGREACRPNHQRAAFGDRLDPASHPNWWQWGCYTHWVSYDKLGKPAGGPQASGQWGGPDREHWSNHRLIQAAVLTGSPLLRALVRDQELGFLGGETIDTRLATSHAGAARGIGRTLASAVAILQLTENPRLAARMRDRLTKIIGPECRKTGLVRPIHTHGKDGRNLGGLYPFWTPWEHGLAMYGLALAAEEMQRWETREPGMGYQDAANVASALFHQTGETLVQYGWWREGSMWVCGKAVAWQGENSPLEPSEYPGPKAESYHGYNLWVLPALHLYQSVLVAASRPVPDKLNAILAELLPEHHERLMARPFPPEARWGLIRRVPVLPPPP